MTDRYNLVAYASNRKTQTIAGLEHQPAREQFKRYRDAGAWRIKVYKSTGNKTTLITDWRDIRR